METSMAWMRKAPKGKPLLLGVPDASGQELLVWCPYCHTSHRHSWKREGWNKRIEHRFAHCDDGSPFLDGGYYIGDAHYNHHGSPPDESRTLRVILRGHPTARVRHVCDSGSPLLDEDVADLACRDVRILRNVGAKTIEEIKAAVFACTGHILSGP